MEITYSGPLPRVSVPALGDRIVTRGTPIEVPDGLGASLCEQPVWQMVDGVPAQEGEHPPFAEWTVEGLRQLGDEWGLEIPSKALKAEIVALVAAESDRRAQHEAAPVRDDSPETDSASE